MNLFSELRKRRVFQWLGAYLAGGFLALEGVQQLVDNQLLPAVAWRIALVFYLFGIPGSSILAWFHGEKGAQKPPPAELWLQGALLVAALTIAGFMIRDYRAQAAAMDAAATAGLDPRGVGVLYFEDLSADGGMRFVADGLTEALIDRLSTVRALDVVSANGVAEFRDSDLARDSIARVLDVGNLVEGSVEPRGDRLRITARLVDGLSGADVERTTFELPRESLLAARDSVARSISDFLRERLGEEVRLRERRAGTSNVEAWSLVQRAEGLRKRATELEEEDQADAALGALEQADSLLLVAETLDSTWTQPPVLQAKIAAQEGLTRALFLGDRQAAAESLRSGLPPAERALSLSSGDPDALEARGTIRYILWLLDVATTSAEADRLVRSARSDLEAAVGANPTLASAWALLSHLYGNLGDQASVILAARRAYEEDAFLRNADQVVERLFWAHFNLEQFNDARQWCQEGRRRFPADEFFVKCGLWLMLAPTEEARPDSAWALHERLVETTPAARKLYDERLGYLLVAGVLRRAERPDSAEAVFARGSADEEIDPTHELMGQEARIRAATGDVDGAMQLLKRYVAANPGHTFEVGGQLHWMWRPLRERPDFQTLLSRP